MHPDTMYNNMQCGYDDSCTFSYTLLNWFVTNMSAHLHGGLTKMIIIVIIITNNIINIHITSYTRAPASYHIINYHNNYYHNHNCQLSSSIWQVIIITNFINVYIGMARMQSVVSEVHKISVSAPCMHYSTLVGIYSIIMGSRHPTK